MSILAVEHLTFTYGTKTKEPNTVLHDLSFSIEEGEVLGIIGETGSGKSTLIQQLNGLLRPTSGRVLLKGQDIWADKKQMQQVRFQVGMVFQYPEYQLFEETVEKDIAFGPQNQGLSGLALKQRVEDAITFVGLNPALRKKSPFDLSGGEKRRAAIAGVIAMNPAVLILDEPTAGLDPEGRQHLLKQLMDYHHSVHNTIVLVSHSMDEVAAVCDRVLVLEQGSIAMLDTTERVFSHTEKLLSLGLRPPQMTTLFATLQQAGFPSLPTVFTVDQAVEALLPYLQKEVPYA